MHRFHKNKLLRIPNKGAMIRFNFFKILLVNIIFLSCNNNEAVKITWDGTFYLNENNYNYESSFSSFKNCFKINFISTHSSKREIIYKNKLGNTFYLKNKNDHSIIDISNDFLPDLFYVGRNSTRNFPLIVKLNTTNYNEFKNRVFDISKNYELFYFQNGSYIMIPQSTNYSLDSTYRYEVLFDID